MYVYVYTYIYTHPSIPMFEPMTVKIAPNYNDSARYWVDPWNSQNGSGQGMPVDPISCGYDVKLIGLVLLGKFTGKPYIWW